MSCSSQGLAGPRQALACCSGGSGNDGAAPAAALQTPLTVFSVAGLPGALPLGAAIDTTAISDCMTVDLQLGGSVGLQLASAPAEAAAAALAAARLAAQQRKGSGSGGGSGQVVLEAALVPAAGGGAQAAAIAALRAAAPALFIIAWCD